MSSQRARPSSAGSEVTLDGSVEEQTALRRLATLVASSPSPERVFAAAAQEAGRLLGAERAVILRYEQDHAVTPMATWEAAEAVGPALRDGIPVAVDGDSLTARVWRTRQPARIDEYGGLTGILAQTARAAGARSGVGAPITVDDRLWGCAVVHFRKTGSGAPGAEARLGAFAELVATAISNTEARLALRRLADEQAALRRVATLVAGAPPTQDVFSAAAEESGRLLGADRGVIFRFEQDAEARVMATWQAEGNAVRTALIDERVILAQDTSAGQVLRTGAPVKIDNYAELTSTLAQRAQAAGIRSAIAAPIVVEDRLWGCAVVAFRSGPPAAGAETRLEGFTALVATAIADTEARAELSRLAEEQAALRRVATLVAEQAAPSKVFAAVTEEVGRLLGSPASGMVCYRRDGAGTVLAAWGRAGEQFPVGMRLELDGDSVTKRVRDTGRSARVDDYPSTTGQIATRARVLEARSTVGSPIVVDGRLWGALLVGAYRAQRLPPRTEERIAKFTELVATAISNVDARAQLAASRARLAAAADEERRRVVRDLHDGAQQSLVQTVVTLKLAQRTPSTDPEAGSALLEEALASAERATAELRELAQGILPSALTLGGLPAAVEVLVARTSLPVKARVSVPRLPAAIEASAYFVIAESLTNVAKHAHAQEAEVDAYVADDSLELRVRDDGVGGARADGSGLLGLADRLAALHGRLRVEAPSGGGTVISASIPLAPPEL